MPQPRLPGTPLVVQRARLEDIPRQAWDRLLAQSPAATPFSGWTFQRAWWDAYGDTARPHYLVVSAAEAETSNGATPAADAIRAIVPLMRRTEADGVVSLFMAASYHADYATVLAHPQDLPEVALLATPEILPATEPVFAAGVASGSGAMTRDGWEVVDLRRLRRADPALAALRQALGEAALGAGWRLDEVVEDVCPVVTLAADWEAQLAGLSRKARHEVRRKIRRAERAGPVRLRYLPLEAASVEHLISMHQARWGEAGLFTPGEDGERGRALLHRLAELESMEGAAARFHLAEVAVGERVVYALAGFDDGVTTYFYNAGMDPTARDLSPGVVGTAAYLQDRIAAGRHRFDFLRGDESYKYEWGASDEPVHQLVATRLPGVRS